MILHSKCALCPSLISMLFMGVVKTGACVVASSTSSKAPLAVPRCSRCANWVAWLEDSVMIFAAAEKRGELTS